MKNKLDRHVAKEKTTELENTAIETIQDKTEKKERKKLKDCQFSSHYEAFQYINTFQYTHLLVY